MSDRTFYLLLALVVVAVLGWLYEEMRAADRRRAEREDRCK